jgi:hypothetical protein
MSALFFGSVITFLYLLAIRVGKRPSHAGEWELDYLHLPRVELKGSEATLRNVRDWQYAPDGSLHAQSYRTDVVRYEAFRRVWVVMEPFMLARRIAHVFLVFELEDGRAFGVSIEARRRKRQGFRPFRALFREYELIYQWATERDVLSLRALRRKSELYMVPLSFDRAHTKQLFVELAQKTNKLFTQPRFYNTLFTNCTTELFDPLASIYTEYRLPYKTRIFTGGVIDALVEKDLVAWTAPWPPHGSITERIAQMPTHVLSHNDPKKFSCALRDRADECDAADDEE